MKTPTATDQVPMIRLMKLFAVVGGTWWSCWGGWGGKTCIHLWHLFLSVICKSMWQNVEICFLIDVYFILSFSKNIGSSPVWWGGVGSRRWWGILSSSSEILRRYCKSIMIFSQYCHTCKKLEIVEIYLRNFFWIFRKILGWEREINIFFHIFCRFSRFTHF